MKIENVWTNFTVDSCQIAKNIHFFNEFDKKIEKILTDFVVNSYQIINESFFTEFAAKL